MIRSYIFIILLGFIFSHCNHVTFRRNINVNLNDKGDFNQSTSFTKEYSISTTQIVNAVSKNIDAKNARIEKLEIKSMKILVDLLPGNTATSIHNVSFTLKKLGTSDVLAKLNDSGKFINSATVYALNKFIEAKILLGFKEDIAKGLATGKLEIYKIEMKGSIPAGQTLKGSISLQIEASMEAVTCELVPFGLGPSECF